MKAISSTIKACALSLILLGSNACAQAQNLSQSNNSTWLSNALEIPLLEYLQITLSLCQFEQIIDQKMLSWNRLLVHQTKITDSSILHLPHLLRTEMETPQLLTQQFVSSLVTILTTHCLQS